MLRLVLCHRRLRLGDSGEILDDFFGVLGLASARLTRHQDALVPPFFDQISKGLIGHGKNVGFRVLSAATLIHVDVFIVIYG